MAVQSPSSSLPTPQKPSLRSRLMMLRSNRKFVVISLVGIVGVLALLLAGAATTTPTKSTLINLSTCSSTSAVKCYDGAQPSGGSITYTQKDSQIVYYSNLNAAQYQIYKMNADGTNRVNLTKDDAHAHNWPRVSPNGSTIIFYKAAPGKTVNEIDTNSLWAMNSDGTNQREIIPFGTYGWDRQGHAEWSPDGTKIVMAAGKGAELHIYTTDAAGKNPVQVTNRRSKVNNAVLTTIDPSWGPDGKKIVYVGCPDDHTLCFPEDNEIYEYNLETKVEKRLTNDKLADFDPYISPDGSTYVWLRCVGSLFFGGPWALYKSSTSTFSMQPLIDDGQINTNATFSHDGKTLLFGRRKQTDPGRFKIFSIGVDGQNLKQVSTDTTNADEGTAAYLP